MTDQDTAAITVPLDLFKRLVELADKGACHEWDEDLARKDVNDATREIEQVEALLASPLE